MRNKTIWILNHHAMPPDLGGGTRHYDFGKELIKRGYKVFIFASSFIHNQHINILGEKEKSKQIIIDGINWVWINTREYSGNGKDRILGMFDFYRFIIKNYNRYEKPDVIIGSAVHLLACIAGYKISKKTGALNISEIRDLWPETLIELGSLKRNGIIAWIMYRLENYVYNRATSIIVTAPGMIDYIVGKGINKSRIKYINNGIDVETFDNNRKQCLIKDTEIRLDKSKFNVIYIGAFGKANALDTLLNAAVMINESSYKNKIAFTLVGDGPQKEGLKAIALSKKVQNINFYHTISKKYVPDLLSHADCLIFSAVDTMLYQYGISANKLFDYMCSGKPIVYAINSMNNYIMESGCGITIEPENPTAMSSAIIKLYELPMVEREAMGTNGRKYVKDHFDIPVLVNKLEEVLCQ